MNNFAALLLAVTMLMPSYSTYSEVGKDRTHQVSIDVDRNGEVDFTLAVAGWTNSVEPEIKRTEYAQAVYTTYSYQNKNTSFQLTIVETKQGEVLYFAEQGKSRLPVDTVVTLVMEDQSKSYHYLQPKWPDTKTTFEGEWKRWIPKSPTDPLPLRPVYIDGKELFARLGSVEQYMPQGFTVYKKQKTEAVTRKQEEDRNVFSFRLSGGSVTQSKTWGMLSHRPLVMWGNPKAENIALQLDQDTFRKLASDGLYDITPTTYKPSSSQSYYRNPANISGLHHVYNAWQPKAFGSLAYGMLTHLAYTALQNQNASGYWETKPMSAWLNTDYRIGYNYFDNRRNADNVTFLLRYNRLYPDPAIQQALNKFDSFLYRYMDETHLKTSETGYLLPDYVDQMLRRVSHTSLNHHLAVLNYLLESQLFAPSEQKKTYIGRLLQGVADTEERWIMKDSNLYYALYRDLTPHPSKDYKVLTLEDLLLTRALMLQLGMFPHDSIDRLIASKQSWLEQQPVSTLKP